MGRNGHPDGQPTFFGSVERRFMSWPDHREALARSRGQGWAPGHRKAAQTASLTAASTAPGSVRPGESRRDRHARHQPATGATLDSHQQCCMPVCHVRVATSGGSRRSACRGRDGGGLILLFEALVRALVSAMPGNAVARLVGEHDTRLWRVIGSTACRQAPEGPFGLRGCLPPLQKSTQLGTTWAARNLAYQVSPYEVNKLGEPPRSCANPDNPSSSGIYYSA